LASAAACVASSAFAAASLALASADSFSFLALASAAACAASSAFAAASLALASNGRAQTLTSPAPCGNLAHRPATLASSTVSLLRSSSSFAT